MSQLKIKIAMEKRLAAYAAAHSLVINYEGTPAIPSGDYIRCEFFPSPTRDPSIGAIHRRYYGTMRLTVMSAVINKGTAAIDTLAEQLIELFPRGLQIVDNGLTVNIENTPSVVGKGCPDKYMFRTVDIVYRCDTITN